MGTIQRFRGDVGEIARTKFKTAFDVVSAVRPANETDS